MDFSTLLILTSSENSLFAYLLVSFDHSCIIKRKILWLRREKLIEFVQMVKDMCIFGLFWPPTFNKQRSFNLRGRNFTDNQPTPSCQQNFWMNPYISNLYNQKKTIMLSGINYLTSQSFIKPPSFKSTLSLGTLFMFYRQRLFDIFERLRNLTGWVGNTM